MLIIKFLLVWPKCSSGCSFSAYPYSTSMELDYISEVWSHTQSADSSLETSEDQQWCANLRELQLEELNLNALKELFLKRIMLTSVLFQTNLHRSPGATKRHLMMSLLIRVLRTVLHQLLTMWDKHLQKNWIVNAERRNLALFLSIKSTTGDHSMPTNAMTSLISSCKFHVLFHQRECLNER